MKKPKTTLLAIILGLLGIQCQTPTPKVVRLPVTPASVQLNKITTIQLMEDVYSIGRIGYGNFISTQAIYLIDRFRHTVVAFNYSGQFIGIIGQQGQSTGAYTEPIAIFAQEDKNRLFVFDGGRFKTICYTLDNRYQFEKHFHQGYPYPGEMQATNNGYIVAFFQFQDTLRWKNVRYFHFLTDKLDIINEWSINFPEPYQKFNWINLASIFWQYHTQERQLYLTFYAVPEIHIYHQGRPSAIWQLSLKPFHLIDRAVPFDDLFLKAKFFAQYSFVDGLYLVNDHTLLLTYHDTQLPEAGDFDPFESRKYRRYYYVLIDIRKRRLMQPSPNQLAGYLLGVTNNQLFVLESDTPGNRRIGVHELKWD